MNAQLIGNGLLVARISRQSAAILTALQLQGACTDALLGFNDSSWQQVLAFCERMQLTLPLALQPSMGFPSWVNERLTANLRDTARRFARAKATYRELAVALQAAGVPHLVLKGFAQAPDFVRAPQYRMQSDIDLYTDPPHLQAVVRALQAIGYQSSGPEEIYRDADHVPTLTRYGDWRPGPNSFDPGMPLALDLHFCLWNPAISMIQLPEVDDFWNRRVTRKLGDLTFTALSPVDHLGYFALHVLRELFAGGRVLHHARELATFLHERAGDASFWTEWQTLHSPRLRQVQAVPMALAAAAFSSRLADAVYQQIAHLPTELHVWMETCGGDLLTTSFSRTRDGRLLQFLLADSPGVRRRLLWKALSPGAVAGPATFASWPEQAVIPPVRPRRKLWRYPLYLASRVSINAGAVLRLVLNGLTIFFSSLAFRRDATIQ